MICPSCNAPNRDDAKFCKKCGQSFPTASQVADGGAEQAQGIPLQGAQTEQAVPVSAPVEANQTSAPSQAHGSPDDDPNLPTQILSPQQMMAYHNRRWQQDLEREQQAGQATQAENEVVEVSVGEPALAPTSSSMPAPAHNEQAQDDAEIPAALMNSSSNAWPTLIPQPSPVDEPIPIPPPPPPSSLPPTDTPATPAETQMVGQQPMGPTEENNAMEVDSTGASESASATPKEENGVTQISTNQPDQAEPTGDFPALAAGAIVNGRYEVTEVASEEAHEHIYHVIDHQGYQHCWNCGSEQNREGDEFCIDCGAELLNIAYNMHEYPALESKDVDASVLQGNIVNTFVEHGHTYVIEQVEVEQNAFPNGIHLLAAGDSDAGNVRRSEPNEDSVLVLMLQRVHESIATPAGVFIVADGLGGHDNGQVASRLTIAIIAERMVRELLSAPLAAEKAGETVKPLDEEALVNLLQGSVEDANAAICLVNQREKTDMGSTITGFMVVGDHAYILNVGDSRTYMMRGGQIYQLTNDHSLVGQLVAGGLIQPDDVYTHPQRSQIFRSLGDKLNVQIDIFKQQVHPGDILLSCSDGLWEMVRNPQIESILNNAPDPQTACTQLLEAANTNGGEDNVSAVVVLVH